MLSAIIKVLDKINNLPESEQTDILNIFKTILDEDEFKSIINKLSLITDDPNNSLQTRKNTLERIDRYITSASKKNQMNFRDPDKFFPPVRFGEVVLVNFSGIGSEHDFLHYAIVWDVDSKRDHIVVIPTTSFKDDFTVENGTAFNIGNIGFLPEETVILLHQITTISRKRILKNRFKEPTSGELKVISVTRNQEERIRDGLRVIWLKEKTLLHELINNRKKIPILSDYDNQINHLHRPFLKNIDESNQETLVYSLYDEPDVKYSVELHSHNSEYEVRRNLIKNWVNAKANYNYSGTEKKDLLRSREENRLIAYHKLKEHILEREPVEQE